MQEVQWERTADGKHAKLKIPRTGLKIGGFLLRELASAKMSEVNIISADFQATTLVFTLLLGVFFDRGGQAEFRGIYQLSGPVDEEISGQVYPTLCLKKAFWEKKKDDQQFRHAERKRAYVQGEEQLDSQIVFVAKDTYPNLDELVQKVQKLVYKGITLTPALREESEWQEVRFDFRDEALVFALTYSPLTHTTPELEHFLVDMQRSFAQVDFTKGIIADDGCFVSYPLSVLERLNLFAE